MSPQKMTKSQIGKMGFESPEHITKIVIASIHDLLIGVKNPKKTEKIEKL